MKVFKKVFFCLLLVLGCAAVVNAEDNIYLTDGSVVHGTIIKKFPSGSIKIKKDSGKITVYKKKQIKRVTHTTPMAENKTVEVVSHRHMKSHRMEKTAENATNGVNNIGRPGYFYSDTAFVPAKNQIMGSAGAVFYSPGSQLVIPVGAAFGITDNIQVHASSNFYTGGGVSGLGYLTVGGKYKFNIDVNNLLISAGIDFSDGPLTGSGYTTFVFDPYGIATYTFVDGFQLNGQLGVAIGTGSTISSTYGGKTYSVSVPGTSYIQLNAGAAYPFDRDLTGIAELDINGQGSGATPLIVGIRTGHDVQLQAFGGLDLAGTVGVLIGGNVALVSE